MYTLTQGLQAREQVYIPGKAEVHAHSITDYVPHGLILHVW